TDVSATEGSLVVGEFDERERGMRVALGEGVHEIERGVDVANRRAISPSRRQELFDLLQFVADRLLSRLEGLYFLQQLIERIARWLRQTDLRHKEYASQKPFP